MKSNEAEEKDTNGGTLPPLHATPGSRVVCEECGARLNATHQDSPVMTAVRAKAAGVWVKNFAIHGDESGYHYFCRPGHGSEWARKHIFENDKVTREMGASPSR